MHSWNGILSTCDEIEELLRTAAPGADTQKLREVRTLALRMSGRDSYITDQANKLASRASIYFSERRHQAEQGGADGVMREMRYSLLRAIREQANVLDHGSTT
jgi:hypothetical protein